MRELFSKQIFNQPEFFTNKDFIKIFDKIFKAGGEVALVGGVVRSILLNEDLANEQLSFDLATNLNSKKLIKIFGDEIKYIEEGLRHGTVIIKSNNFIFEVTTLRVDTKSTGRYSAVIFQNNWKEDSARRDLTINSIYLDINGKIFDPQMGTVDLKNNNVKFIGDPRKRIEEDYLRIIRFIRFKIMYDSKVEATTNNAIKQNLIGIKKISKERILVELFKILNLKSFINLNESTYLKEIFNLIFPEFANLKRLVRLKKILNSSKINLNLLLAILLIDKDSNHEYFCHKYNVSNDIKDDLNLLAKNLKLLQNNKDFFTKDIEKHIYLNDKSHLINLNIINFTANSKYNLKNFSEVMKNILKSKTHKFDIDGKYLINKGMREGVLMGKVLKKIEEEWMENNFKISDVRVQEIIKKNS